MIFLLKVYYMIICSGVVITEAAILSLKIANFGAIWLDSIISTEKAYFGWNRYNCWLLK